MNQHDDVNLLKICEMISQFYEDKKKLSQEPFSFFVGITGGVAVGKSTLTEQIKNKLQELKINLKINTIPLDNFIYGNKLLIQYQLFNRKGFPESFDMASLKNFFLDLNSEQFKNTYLPFYSQNIKDIHPEKNFYVEKSDIYLIEGINIFFSYEDNFSKFKVKDYLDFCIYLDADLHNVKNWYVNRYRQARKSSSLKNDQNINNLWDGNVQLLKQYLEPFIHQADCIIKKSSNHALESIIINRKQ